MRWFEQKDEWSLNAALINVQGGARRNSREVAGVAYSDEGLDAVLGCANEAFCLTWQYEGALYLTRIWRELVTEPHLDEAGCAVVWHGDELAVAWESAKGEIRFCRVSASGEKLGSELTFGVTPRGLDYLWLSWTGNGFGLVWSERHPWEHEWEPEEGETMMTLIQFRESDLRGSSNEGR